MGKVDCLLVKDVTYEVETVEGVCLILAPICDTESPDSSGCVSGVISDNAG